MGVKLLRSLLDKNLSAVSQQFSLPRQNNADGKKHPLIIDGYAWLFPAALEAADEYGGCDQHKLVGILKSQLDALMSVSFSPIVVLDGCARESKEETQKIRRTQMSQAVNRMVIFVGQSPQQTPEGLNLLSLGVSQTFVTFLYHAGVQYFICDQEADEVIATLSRDLSCPVLSDDSDFLVQPHIKGCMSLRYLQISETNVHFRVFYPHMVAEMLRIAPEHLLCFASLVGNDYACIDDQSLQQLLWTLAPPKSRKDAMTAFYQSHGRLRAVAACLSTFPTSKALHQALLAIQDPALAATIKDTIQLNGLFAEPSPVFLSDTTGLTTFDGTPIPPELVRRYRRGHFRTFEVFVTARFFCPIIFEDASQINAWTISQAIRMVCYGILLIGHKREDDGKIPCVTEIVRKGSNPMASELVRPVIPPGFAEIKSFLEISQLPLDSRWKVWFEIMRSDGAAALQTLPNILMPLFYSLRYLVITLSESSYDRLCSWEVNALIYSVVLTAADIAAVPPRANETVAHARLDATRRGLMTRRGIHLLARWNTTIFSALSLLDVLGLADNTFASAFPLGTGVSNGTLDRFSALNLISPWQLIHGKHVHAMLERCKRGGVSPFTLSTNDNSWSQEAELLRSLVLEGLTPFINMPNNHSTTASSSTSSSSSSSKTAKKTKLDPKMISSNSFALLSTDEDA